ncbi:MAG: hypothetical protein K9K36_06090, partial [Desulfarculaceae bacterium]|nr:hypothetical protein [Desulfarculaceae bacterium]
MLKNLTQSSFVRGVLGVGYWANQLKISPIRDMRDTGMGVALLVYAALPSESEQALSRDLQAGT